MDMPLKSKAQQRYMFSQHPEVAKEMASKMTHREMVKLPEKKKRIKRYYA